MPIRPGGSGSLCRFQSTCRSPPVRLFPASNSRAHRPHLVRQPGNCSVQRGAARAFVDILVKALPSQGSGSGSASPGWLRFSSPDDVGLFEHQLPSESNPPTKLVSLACCALAFSFVCCHPHTAEAAAAEGTALASQVHPGLGTSLLHHTLSGGLGGSIGAAVVYPIDVVKTRLQAQRSHSDIPQALDKLLAVSNISDEGRGAHGEIRANEPELPYYSGPLDCFLSILRTEGLHGMYSGLLPQLIGVWPDKAVKLSANEFMLGLLWNSPSGASAPLMVQLGAGLFSGVFQVIFSNPREVVKIQMQMTGGCMSPSHSSPIRVPLSPAPRGSGAGRMPFVLMAASVDGYEHRPSQLHLMAEAVRELGLKGLYRGAPVCAARDMTFGGILFPLYAAVKTWLAAHGCQGIGWVWLAGTAAGIPAAFLTTPIDVIKTRVQAPRPGSSAEHLTARQHLTQLLEEPGGWHRLLAGAGPRVLRSAPQFGVTLVVYEMINKSMGW